MARVTVEDCLKNVENRFELIMLASKRARQLTMTAVEPRVNAANHKPTVVALMEIAEGHTVFEEFNEDSLKKTDFVPYHHLHTGPIAEGE